MQVEILPSRQVLVDRIELQYEYGQSIICLLGEAGLGKSYILESFVTDKFTNFNKIYLQLNARTTDQQVVSQLLEQVFNKPLIDYNKSLYDNFIALNDQQQAADLVLVIDNTQYLSVVLSKEIALLTTATNSVFYILTASNTQTHFPDTANIFFEPLTNDESVQLLAMYFSKLPNVDEPIFKSFLTEAKGNPSLLLSWQPDTAKPVKKKNPKLLMLAALVFVVVITILLSYFFDQLGSSKAQMLLESSVESSKQAVMLKDKVDSDIIKDAAANVAVATEMPLLTVSREVNQTQLVTIKATPVDIAAILFASPKQKVKTIEALALPTRQEKSDSNVAPKIEMSSIATSVVAKPMVSGSVILKPVVLKQIALSSQTTTNTQTKVSTPAPLYDNTWFTQQASNLVMLQLIGISQQGLVNNFMALHKLTNVKVYQSHRYGGNWWVVTLGPYNSVALSQQAKLQLSEPLQKLKPFSKTIKAIKKEIALLKVP